MPIEGVAQPEILQIDQELRLRRFDGVYPFAFDWYQDQETVYMVDGVKKPYTWETLQNMYQCLNKKGELYFIELKKDEGYVPIGDVTFWQQDMPIVIGEKTCRGKGIAKKVVSRLVDRGRELGYPCLYVEEIYDYNIPSRKCFEAAGFTAYKKTEQGSSFRLQL